MPDASFHHQPVLALEVAAAARGAGRIVDATLGGGGHAEVLRASGAELLGIDRDPAALAAARRRLGTAGVRYLEDQFASEAALEAVRAFHPDFILLDLGVSSPQLDDESRGFSFRPGVPLDMRMGGAGPGAADLLNALPEADLRLLFGDYGDEPRAGRLAREVIRRRANTPFAVSDDFVNAIRAVLGPRAGPGDFARLFQALRIAVNDELGGLIRALPALLAALAPGGRLAVISYHSGEDRIVKRCFQEWARSCICPTGLPVCRCRGRALGAPEPRWPIRPAPIEVAANPRARSARLRLFRKSDE